MTRKDNLNTIKTDKPMKKLELIIATALMAIGVTAQAQSVDFNNPAYAAWGDTPEAREQNMFTSSYLKVAVDSKDYDKAAGYFQTLIASCPTAAEPIYQRGVVIYKAKIARAKSLSEKKIMVDSLMLVHDLRAMHFGNHATRGMAYIKDSKARDYFQYNKSDREGLREVFKAAIDANPESVDLDLVLLYFQNLCEDYNMDEIFPDVVISEYEALVPIVNRAGADATAAAKLDSAFGTSGVASCENLERIYKTKLESAPDDINTLAQAVKLMDRAGCTTPFYAQVAEKYYQVKPSSTAAMALAAIFQKEGQYDKASKYLRDALAAESDIEEQEKLHARIALVELAAGRMDAALKAARASLKTEDGTQADNGIALFVIAQCYAASATACEGFEGQAVYWAAFDTMHRATKAFTAEEENYLKPAQAMMASYRQYFPTSEECFFNEVKENETYTVKCGIANGITTTVRIRK